MIKSIKLKLSGGEFEIIRGTDFSVTSDNLDHLLYEKDGVWHVVSDPCRGKYAHTVITIPYQRSFYNAFVEISDGVLTMCPIDCDNLGFDINGATADVSDAVAQNLYIKTARGDMRISASSVLTDIDCGYGTININMAHHKHGYKTTSSCGMGTVTLNSELLPKKFTSHEGERRINIICGMGNVNINT